MSGGGAGSGRRGGNAGIDEVPAAGGVAWSDFRREDLGGAFVSASTRVHVAGVNSQIQDAGAQSPVVQEININTLHGGAGSQMLYAVPAFFNRAGRLTRLGIKVCANVGAGNLARLGIYNNADDADPYPGSKLYDSGDLDCSVAGWRSGAAQPSVSFDATDLLWEVFICNASMPANTTTIMGFPTTIAFPILGSTVTDSFATAVDKTSFGCAYRHAHAWNGGALPDPFPVSAPVVVTVALGSTATLPAIFHGWNRA